MSLTPRPSFSHSTSRTRYCGYVTPNLSSIGRYTAVVAREAEYSAKHT